MSIYVELADDIARQIGQGVLRAGEKLPSVRSLRETRNVSQSTIMQAYYLLEDRGLISTRPRSGFYVNAKPRLPLRSPAPVAAPAEPMAIEVSNLLYSVLNVLKRREHVPLGSALISPSAFPLQKLALQLGSAARRLAPTRFIDDLPPGNPELRRLLARRYLEIGAQVDAEGIVITNGASEALQLCIFATTKPGDVVAMEAPSHYNALHVIETSGRRALSIPTDAQKGMDLAALENAIDKHNVKAVWAMPTFQNPTGALMPVERKRALVAMLARREIPLIENDVYGELYFDGERPPPAKAFDKKGLVLHCSSFSKILSPGYRIGWVAPGQFFEPVRQHKFLLSVASNIAAQEAISEYIKHGGYELHLRRMRSVLKSQRDSLLRAVTRYFPEGTRVSRPEGGYLLWVQLPPGSLDTLELAKRALNSGVSSAPGALFSTDGQFGSYLRLNFGHPWTPELERGVELLGKLAADQEA